MKRLFDDDAALKGAGIGLLCILLAAALLGAGSQAYAAKAAEGQGEGAAAEGEQASSDGDAFRLGHVAVELVDGDAATSGSDESGAGDDALVDGVGTAEATEQDEGADPGESKAPDDPGGAEGPDEPLVGCRLAVGMPQERLYRITNTGEASYIRLATHTLLGDLDHNNGSAVVEESAMGEGGATSEEDASEGGDAPEAKEAAASDGAESEGGGGNDGSGESDGNGGATDEEPLWRFAEDGFWYRCEPLEVDQSIVVRVTVEIPFEDDWIAALSTGSPSTVTESLRVDAVQARNVVIDPHSADPWGLAQDGQDAEGAERPAEGEAEAKAEAEDMEGGAR